MEYEVKFKIENKEEILGRLKKLAAEDLGEAFEADVYLNLGQKVVRVRKVGGRGLVTYKKRIDEDTRAKVREEIETGIDDAERMITVFKELGFSELKRKEKVRRTFKLGESLVLIDKLPFMGYFIELEASSDAELRKMCKKLDLDYEQSNGDSYDNLFFKYYIKNARKFANAKVKILPIFENEKEFLNENI